MRSCKQANNKNNGAQIPAPLSLQINHNQAKVYKNTP